MKKTKLELNWIGKENRPRLEPRILLEDAARSYHAPHRLSESDRFDNRLIQGDNLLALKALEHEFAGGEHHAPLHYGRKARRADAAGALPVVDGGRHEPEHQRPGAED